MRDAAIYIAVIVGAWAAFLPVYWLMETVGLAGDVAIIGAVAVVTITVLSVSYLNVRLRAWGRRSASSRGEGGSQSAGQP